MNLSRAADSVDCALFTHNIGHGKIAGSSQTRQLGNVMEVGEYSGGNHEARNVMAMIYDTVGSDGQPAMSHRISMRERSFERI